MHSDIHRLSPVPDQKNAGLRYLFQNRIGAAIIRFIPNLLSRNDRILEGPLFWYF